MLTVERGEIAQKDEEYIAAFQRIIDVCIFGRQAVGGDISMDEFGPRYSIFRQHTNDLMAREKSSRKAKAKDAHQTAFQTTD